MSSSLFQPRNNPLSQIAQLKKTIESLRNGNADAISEQMQRSNPQFAQFVSRNKGKSAQQILKQSGINLDELKNLLEMLK